MRRGDGSTRTSPRVGGRRGLGQAVLLLGALVLSSCADETTDGSEASATGERSQPSESSQQPEASQGPEPPPPSEELPDTAAGAAAEEILAVLNAETPNTAELWDDLLAEEFLADVPAQQMVELVETGFLPTAPWSIYEVDGGAEDRQLVAEIRDDVGTALQMHVGLTDEELVETLLFTEPQPDHQEATSYEEIGERLEALPGQASVLITETAAEAGSASGGNSDAPGGDVGGDADDSPGGDADDVTVHLAAGEDEPAPLASVAKLAVLWAVVEAVESEELAWTDALTVTDELRSLPSGELQDADTGTQVTVAEAAQLMIEISDNTATDMLIDALGRETVEQATADVLGEAEGLTPFLTTREMFHLRFGEGDSAFQGAEQWAQSDVSQRLEILAELADEPFDVDADDVQGAAGYPAEEPPPEWYASAEDVAALHEALAVAEQEHEQLSAILGSNPGLTDIEDAWWDELAFKGGSSPGVLTGSWQVRTEDGRTLTVVILTSAQQAQELAAQQTEVFGLTRDALMIAGEEEEPEPETEAESDPEPEAGPETGNDGETG